MQHPADALTERLGLPIRDRALLEQALVHSSWLHEHPDAARGHNERLEFLGDAVVNLAVSEALYRRHPADDEGVLSARRAAIVSTPGLARLAARLDLGQFLLLGEGEAQRGGRVRPSLLASAFEALIGAIYLDLGWEAARDWIHERAEAEISADLTLTTLKSPKSRLQEHTQRTTGERPVYHLLEAVGPDHEKRFRIEVARRRARAGDRRGAVAPGRRDLGRRPGARRAQGGAPRGARRPGRRVRRRARPAGDAEPVFTEGEPVDALDADGRRRSRLDDRPGAPPRPPRPGLQVVRRADAGRVRAGDQRGRRPQRLGQVEPRRRAPLGARRAGPVAPDPQERGRHLGRLREAQRPGHGRRDARPRQRRRAAAGRVQRARARAAAVPQRRERLPAQQAAGAAARPPGPARLGEPRRQRVPVHRPGHGRPGARPAARGAAAAVRGGRRRPAPRAPPAQGRGPADRGGGQPRAGRGHPRRAPAAGAAARPARRAAGDPAAPRARSWPPR